MAKTYLSTEQLELKKRIQRKAFDDWLAASKQQGPDNYAAGTVTQAVPVPSMLDAQPVEVQQPKSVPMTQKAPTIAGANQLPTLDAYLQMAGGGTNWKPTQADIDRAAAEQAAFSKKLRDAAIKNQGKQDYKNKDRTVDVEHLYNAGLLDTPTMDNAALAAYGKGMMRLPMSIASSGAKIAESGNRKGAKNVDITSLVNGDYSFTPEQEPWYRRKIGTNVLAENEKVSDAPAIDRIAQYEQQPKLYAPQLADLQNIYYAFEEYMATNPAPTAEEMQNFKRIQDLMYNNDADYRARENAIYYSGQEEQAKEMNPLAFGAGNLTTQIMAYQAASAAGAATGLTGAIENGIGGLAGESALGQFAANKGANLLVNQIADLAVQDIPRLMADVTDGVGTKQALKNFAKNELENAAYNIGIDAAGTAAKSAIELLFQKGAVKEAATAYLKSLPEGTDDAATRAIRQAAERADVAAKQVVEQAVNVKPSSSWTKEGVDEEIEHIFRKFDPKSDYEWQRITNDVFGFGDSIPDPALKEYYMKETTRRLTEADINYRAMLEEQAADAAKSPEIKRQEAYNNVFDGVYRNENLLDEQADIIVNRFSRYNDILTSHQKANELFPEKVKEVTDALDVYKRALAGMEDGAVIDAAEKEANKALNRLNYALKKAGEQEVWVSDFKDVRKNKWKYNNFYTVKDEYNHFLPEPEMSNQEIEDGLDVLRQLEGREAPAEIPMRGTRRKRATMEELAKKVGNENLTKATRYVESIPTAPDAELLNSQAFREYKADLEDIVNKPVSDSEALEVYRQESKELLLDYNIQFFARKAEETADNLKAIDTIRVGNNDVNVYDSVPEGWQQIDGAVTAPHGYRWVSNGKSRFGGEYETALVPDEVFRTEEDPNQGLFDYVNSMKQQASEEVPVYKGSETYDRMSSTEKRRPHHTRRKMQAEKEAAQKAAEAAQEPYPDFDWTTGEGKPPTGEPLPVLGEVKKAGDGMPPTNGALEAGEKISKVRTNTMKNAGISNDTELAKDYAEEVYKYATKPEAQSLDEATAQVTADFDGALRKYTTDFTDEAAKQYGSTDADSMMLIYKDLNSRARDLYDAGDIAGANRLYAQAREVTKNMQKAATQSGQYIQAMAKWTRTADGAIATGQGMVDRMVKEALDQNPNMARELGRIAQQIDDELKTIQATDIWKRLEDGTITNHDREALKGELEDMIRSAVDGGKRTKKFTPVEISKLADDILEKQYIDIQRQLEFMETGFGELRPETIQQVEDFFDQAEQFSPKSKQRVELENKMYQAIANDISHGQSFGRKLDAWRYFSMLSNPTTHIRNMTGNVLFGLETGVKDNIAAGIEAAVDRIARTSGEGIHRTKAILTPADRGLVAAAKADFEINAFRDYSGNKWYDVGRGIDAAMPVWDNHTKFGRFMNNITNLNTKALNAEDVIAGQRKYADAMARYLKANGAKSIDGASEELLESARAYALNQAKLATFHQDNAVADSFAQWVRSLKESDKNAAKAIGMALDVTIPFKRTPANILESVAAYSPLEFGKVIMETPKLLKGVVSAADYIDDISKGITGTAGLMVGAWLAHEGILHVNKGNEKEMSYDKMTGKQDMSINVGNYSVKISELAPAAVPLIEGAIVFNHFLSGEKDEDMALNTIVDAASAMAESVTDMTMLQGISDALSNVRYAQSDTDIWESLGAGIASNAVSQLLPTVGSKAERALDPYQRDTYSDKTGAAKKLEQNAKYWTQKVPGLQAAGEALQKSEIPTLQKAGNALAREEKVDARGRTRENFGGNALGRLAYNMLSPVTITKNEATANDKEIKRLAEVSGSDKVYTHIANSEAKVGDYQMTPKEWTQYKKSKGKMQTDLENAFLNSETYKSLNDADRAATIEQIHSFAKDYSQNQIREKSMSKQSAELSEIMEKQGADAVIDKMLGKAAANNAGYGMNTNAGKAISEAASSGRADEIEQIADVYEKLDTIETSKTNSKKAVQEAVESGNVDKAQELVTGMQKFEKAGLKSYDYTHYQTAQQRIPTLTEDQYISGYQRADADGNKSLKQDEILGLMNSDPGNAEMWKNVFWTNPNWKKIPVLGDDGVWRKQ